MPFYYINGALLKLNRYIMYVACGQNFLNLIFQGLESFFDEPTAFECLKCAEGCESCVDSSPCIVTLNWVLRTILLILQCVIIGCLPVVVLFTYKYKEIKVYTCHSVL